MWKKIPRRIPLDPKLFALYIRNSGPGPLSSQFEVMVHARTANNDTNPAAFFGLPEANLQYFLTLQNHSSGQVLCGFRFCINSEISYRRFFSPEAQSDDLCLGAIHWPRLVDQGWYSARTPAMFRV